MGRSRRPRPKFLASKLRAIRLRFGFTQQEMAEQLNYNHPLLSAHISEFENDKREPPVELLLCYARTAGVPLEAIVDDQLSLPH